MTERWYKRTILRHQLGTLLLDALLPLCCGALAEGHRLQLSLELPPLLLLLHSRVDKVLEGQLRERPQLQAVLHHLLVVANRLLGERDQLVDEMDVTDVAVVDDGMQLAVVAGSGDGGGHARRLHLRAAQRAPFHPGLLRVRVAQARE